MPTCLKKLGRANLMKFKIPVSWEMSGIIEVEANTLEKALEYFNTNSDDIPLPDGEYVDSSFTVTGGEDVESIWELYNSQNDGLTLAEANLVDTFARNNVTQCLNGTLSVGDLVMNTPLDDYPIMYGRVIEILPAGSKKALAETENEGDVIHVEFLTCELSESYISEIEEAFGHLYGERKPLADIALDDVIESGDVLIRVDGFEKHRDRLHHSMAGAASVAFELMVKYAGEVFKMRSGILNECHDTLSEYWGELEDSLGTVRLDDEIESIQTKMTRIRELQQKLSSDLNGVDCFVLISVYERDATAIEFPTFEEAHAQMEKELDESLHGNREGYELDEDYSLCSYSAWSNIGGNNDWQIFRF